MKQAKELGFLSGGGAMGARIRALDWAKTPLGPPETWPQSLRSPLSMLLPSKAQIILFWGPEYVSFYNDAYIPVFGGKHPQMLGQPGSVAWSEIWDTGVNLHGLLDGVVRTGEAFKASDMLFPLERHGFVEDTYFDVSYDPVRDESGRVGGVFCIVTETTGRVIGERRLALLRDLGVHNAGARSPHDACALAMETLAAHPQDLPFALAYLGDSLQAATPGAEAARAAAPPELVKELKIPGGRLVVGISPRRPYDGQYESFLGLVADQIGTAVSSARAYDEERQRAEALAELDRAKTAFFSNVSHEFRTPLTLLLGPLEDALAQPGLVGAERERLEVAERNAKRLLRLVNTLLDFSRIEASRLHLRLEPTELDAYTAELSSLFRATLERAGLRLAIDCPPLGEAVPIDREMWEKIVLNLLSNAFKFTFEGEIAVRLRREGERAVLRVTDTGIGIPAEELPHVFERFHRVKDARGRSFEGSGIGLALVQELARLHGGEVAVTSVLGAGTTFTVTVPLAARLEEPAGAPPPPLLSPRAAAFVDEMQSWLPSEEPASPPPADAGGARARILLADDNADMRRYVQRLLETDYDVTAVSDGLAALDAARAACFDLVLTDVMMPKLDGLGLIAALRADERTRTLPIVLLSARAGEESRVEGLAAGADEYLVKPFAARELLVRVGALLRAAAMRAEADRRKDEFLATLSHELRNPLAPLRNSLHLLRAAGHQDSEPIHDIMERQLNHLVRLVDDLLEMSRISRGALELRQERVAMREIVRNAVEASQPLIEAGRHRLELDLPHEPLWLEGDPVRLAQILSNLLNNAAQYTDPGGHIELTARRSDGLVRIWVRDDGPGLAPDVLPQLFEMFSRGDPQRARHQGGLGIGLALSRRLAEMHGGSIEGKSRGVVPGAEFLVSLPLASVQEAAAAAAERAAVPLPSRRILVVDDNRDAADSLSMVLQSLGADVRVARDGREALETYESYDPAVVLLDIGMPGMDGYEVARQIRSRHPQRGTALVALTGWGQDKDRERAREAGFDRHLVKPAEIGALQALLSSL